MVAIAIVLALAAEPKETDSTFANLGPLAAAIARADRITLYEGLPHQVSEKDLLESEIKAKKTVKHHGFAFYAGPLPLKDGDAKSLLALAGNEKSFQPWAGVKKCGGFHPDYLVEFTAGKDVVRMLVCFGCLEVKLHGPNSEVYVDMSDDGLHGLEKVLKPYRENRPKK